MKLFLCSSNESINSRWQESLSELYQDIQLCDKTSSLTAMLVGLGEGINQQEFIILYHLTRDSSDEKALYQFLENYPVAKKMFVMVNVPDSEQGIRLLFAGVHGYANAYLNSEKLKAAVKVIEQGEIWAGEEILLQLLSRHPNPSTQYQKDINLNQLLSNREKQIVDQVLKGQTNKQVGIALNITERTVKAHLSAIFKKTGTRNRFELNVKLKAL
ncbi:MAG: response regulator transcription factor [Pseudomonadota bacterium]